MSESVVIIVEKDLAAVLYGHIAFEYDLSDPQRDDIKVAVAKGLVSHENKHRELV